MSSLKKFETFLNTDIIRALQTSEVVDIAQLSAVIALLIRMNLPFTLTFQQATSENVAAAELVITLTPTTAITLLLPLNRGPVLT